MEFSLGRDTLPSQARSVRGESRRLRRERDNAKKLLSRCLVRRVAQRDRAVVRMRPAFSATGEPPLTLSLFMITCQGTTQARKSNEPVSISAPARAHTCPRRETSNRRREPPFAPSPLAPQPDGLVRIISMVLRDHASLVTHSNHKLVGITVIKPSQRRICPTMLALTSHYSATNAKHPRYAPGLSPESMTRCDHWARYWCEKSFAAELGVVVGSLPPDQGCSDPRSLPPPGQSPQPSRQPRRTRPRQPGQSLSAKIPAIKGAATRNHQRCDSCGT